MESEPVMALGPVTELEWVMESVKTLGLSLG